MTSYNEDDDGMFSEESDDATPNYWAAAEEDDSPQIDRIILHRRKEDSGQYLLESSTDKPNCSTDEEMTNLSKHDFEYLVWIP